MSARCNVRKRDAFLCLCCTFAAGVWTGHMTGRPTTSSSSTGTAIVVRNKYEERGPPTKQELGQAGWTLLHTMAANFPDAPTPRQQSRIEAFLHVLGEHYPCEVCASHFRKHAASHPIVTTTREGLSMWLCEAHNDVNVRNGKEAYFCDLGVLDARWKDCGCGHGNATASTDSLGGPPPSRPPPTRRRRRHVQ